MADVRTTTSTLSLNMGFKDNDTRTISRPNPKSNIAKADILALETWMKTNQPVIGDKGSAEFVRFLSAKTTTRTVIDLDLDDI